MSSPLIAEILSCTALSGTPDPDAMKSDQDTTRWSSGMSIPSMTTTFSTLSRLGSILDSRYEHFFSVTPPSIGLPPKKTSLASLLSITCSASSGDEVWYTPALAPPQHIAAWEEAYHSARL